MTRLNGKTVIVTGAGAGFGGAIATRIAGEGASVVVHDKSDLDSACSIAAVIVSRGGRAIAVGGDVSQANDIRRIFHSTKDVFGTPSMVVNNIVADEIDANLDIFGTFMICEEAGRHLGRGGMIINVHGGNPEKRDGAAIDTLSLGLRPELDLKGIRIISIGTEQHAMEEMNIASTVMRHAFFGTGRSRRASAFIDMDHAFHSRQPIFSTGWRGW